MMGGWDLAGIAIVIAAVMLGILIGALWMLGSAELEYRRECRAEDEARAHERELEDERAIAALDRTPGARARPAISLEDVTCSRCGCVVDYVNHVGGIVLFRCGHTSPTAVELKKLTPLRDVWIALGHSGFGSDSDFSTR